LNELKNKNKIIFFKKIKGLGKHCGVGVRKKKSKNQKKNN
jgi:hypothetical protein